MAKKQEDMQFLGFFGIVKEALNIISTHRKIFSQITLSTILPLSISYVLILMQLEEISGNSNNTFWLFKIAYYIVTLILSLVSTSAVVYSVACIYSNAKEITYKKVMKVVPKVLKRLIITFIWNYIISFALIIAFVPVIIVWFLTLGPSTTIGITVGIILLLISLSGIVYMSFVLQLANVISVLEGVSGIQAMLKSKNLIKGNTGICAANFLIINLCSLGIYFGFKATFVGGDLVLGKLWFALLWFMLYSVFYLFALVIQTIIYFICKSYHHEIIDKLSFADHLELYHEEYVPLSSEEYNSVV